MTYHEVALSPSDGQMSDLSQGIEVRLSKPHFSQVVPFHLRLAQARRYQKAALSGKSFNLKLSAAQIKHMHKMGSGRFSDILRAGYKFAKPALRKGLHAGTQWAEDRVADKLGLQEGEGFFGDLARNVGHFGVDRLVGFAGGSAQPQARTQAGEGFLSDVFKSVGLGVGGTSGKRGGDARPAPQRLLRQQDGEGFFGDLARKVGHIGVNGLVSLAGGSAAPKKRAPRLANVQGEGFFGDMARKVGHFGVDGLVGALGGGINPYANPNEQVAAVARRNGRFQKKAGLGSGLYQ